MTNPPDTASTAERRIEQLLANDKPAFLREAYLVVLGRSLDAAGERFYSARLDAGGDRLEILRELAASDEGRQHLADHPETAGALAGLLGVRPRVAQSVESLLSLSHREFVEQVHLAVLGTAGDARSLALVDALLRGGTPRPHVIDQLAATRRPQLPAPTLAGLDALRSRLHDPAHAPVRSLDELMELQDEAFIHAAYRALFGRNPDPAGLHHYMGLLAEGHSRYRVVAELASSSEARALARPLPGVERVLSMRRWVRLPVLGPLAARLAGMESDSQAARRQRMLEALVRRSYRLESALAGAQPGPGAHTGTAATTARSQQQMEREFLARLEAMTDIQRDSFDREMNALRKLVLQAQDRSPRPGDRQGDLRRRGRR